MVNSNWNYRSLPGRRSGSSLHFFCYKTSCDETHAAQQTGSSRGQLHTRNNMRRREFLALLGTPAYAELARRIGLQTARTVQGRGNASHLARRDRSRPAKNHQDDRLQRFGSRPGLAPARGPTRHGGGTQRHQNPELVHWHGLFVPSEVDGSEEEGTPMVPPGGVRRYSFVPVPRGPAGITVTFMPVGI